MQEVVSSSTPMDPKPWLMAWLLRGKPLTLSERDLRNFNPDVFRYTRLAFRCKLDAHTEMRVVKLFESKANDYNYNITLSITYPQRKRNRTKAWSEQCPAAQIRQTINQLLEHRP